MKEHDIIMGVGTGYDWDQLRNWVKSIRSTDFEGKVVLMSEGFDLTLKRKLESYDIEAYEYNRLQLAYMSAPHVERFFFIWKYLNDHPSNHWDFVVSTDTRDVIFQSDPTKWLSKRGIHSDMNAYVFSTEGLRYEDEPWGSGNFHQTFGDAYWKTYKEQLIGNVGILGGTHASIKSLVNMIFNMSVGRSIPIVDQAVYNFITYNQSYAYYAKNSDDWAVNLGTTLPAVQEGAGDLGNWALSSDENMETYKRKFNDIQPIIDPEGFVTNDKGEKYSMVHQYDRVKDLNVMINERYKDES
jgi:hypothetical protein